MATTRRIGLVSLAISALVAVTLVAPAGPTSAAASSAPSSAYRANDYADGQAMSILPAGENGLVNAIDAAAFESPLKQRPAGSQDQLGKYAKLLYGDRNAREARGGQRAAHRVPAGQAMVPRARGVPTPLLGMLLLIGFSCVGVASQRRRRRQRRKT